MPKMRILNYLVFVALIISTFLDYQSLWGLLFMYWVIPSYYSGHTFLVSDITREDDPFLYWAIIITWFLFGASMIAIDLFPAFFYPSYYSY